MPKSQATEALLQLHQVDTKIDRLTTQKDLLPVAVRRIETHLDQQRQALQEKKQRTKELRTETRSRELLLRGAEEEIQKLTVQLNTARTNKEYAAFQHEIAAKRADASRIEDQVLAAMGDIEELEAEAKDIEHSIAQIQREYDQEAKEVEKDAAELEKQLEALRKVRQAAAAKVEPELLGEYERIAAKKGASALAAVVANSCQGCFMQLPPQFGQLLRNGRNIVRCPSCSRLLYEA